MIIAELIKFNARMLKFLSENGIRIKDYQYTDMYEEYTMMVGNNEKKEYIYAEPSAYLHGHLLQRVVEVIAEPCK